MPVTVAAAECRTSVSGGALHGCATLWRLQPLRERSRGSIAFIG